MTLWRGLKNVKVRKDSVGGTHLGPMSTSSKLDVALKYAMNHGECLLLKIITKNYMSRGVDISYLSCFPGENEFLYPPCTFLQARGMEVIEYEGTAYTIVTVLPVFPNTS